VKTAIVAITRHGLALGERVAGVLPGATVCVPEKLVREEHAARNVVSYQGGTGELLGRLFHECDRIVAIFSIGALVRMIAPFLADKARDPAVVALDGNGRFVIPVLSGHLGGANALAGELAAALGATPVLTTASDVQQTIAVDLLGRELGWKMEATYDETVRASAAMVNEEAVAFVQEVGGRDWWPGHANGRAGEVPGNLTFFDRLEDVPESGRFAALLWVSCRTMPQAYAARFAGRCVVYRPPRRVALGVGCNRGAGRATVEAAVDAALAECGARASDVIAVASIDLKSDEAALLEMAAGRGWTIGFYTAAELAAVEVPNPSETVRRYIGTPSVSAAAALLAARADKTRLLVEKCCRRGTDGCNVTVSVAEAIEGALPPQTPPAGE
jgi:cobalt-precorrin 5A hydrolase